MSGRYWKLLDTEASSEVSDEQKVVITDSYDLIISGIKKSIRFNNIHHSWRVLPGSILSAGLDHYLQAANQKQRSVLLAEPVIVTTDPGKANGNSHIILVAADQIWAEVCFQTAQVFFSDRQAVCRALLHDVFDIEPEVLRRMGNMHVHMLWAERVQTDLISAQIPLLQSLREYLLQVHSKDNYPLQRRQLAVFAADRHGVRTITEDQLLDLWSEFIAEV